MTDCPADSVPSERRVTRAALAALAALAVGCSGQPASELPAGRGAEGLAAHLTAALARVERDPDSAAALTERWRLDRGEFTAVVTSGYDRLYEGYARHYEEARPHFAASLPALVGSPVHARPQYADAAYLSPAQIRLRWALPEGNPGVVAFVGGRPMAPVWVHTGTRWGLLMGLGRAADDVVRARAPCFDQLPDCTAGRCLVEIYRVYRAALSAGAGDVVHACRGWSPAP